MTGGVLALFAHPDDESLLAGGTLAACAAAGLPVHLLSMTRGEAGPVGDGAAARGKDLGTTRERELAAAAGALGARDAECLSYPDGQLDTIDWDVAAADVAARVMDRGPSAVITFGPEGLYWHPDHVAVHYIAREALRRCRVACVYEATWPLGQAARLVDAMTARGLPASLWGLDPGLFGVAPGEITDEVDVAPFLGHKLRALRSHASQLSAGNALAVIPDDLAHAFLTREYFVRSDPRCRAPDWLATVVTGACARPEASA
jgi:LmbE family N-acetylglucosaminyl deacetylase